MKQPMKIVILTETGRTYSPKRLKEEAIKKGHQPRIIRYPKCYVDIEQDNPEVRYEGQEVKNCRHRQLLFAQTRLESEALH